MIRGHLAGREPQGRDYFMLQIVSDFSLYSTSASPDIRWNSNIPNIFILEIFNTILLTCAIKYILAAKENFDNVIDFRFDCIAPSC